MLFLGRVTYPYGYQQPSKKVISRTLLKKIKFDNKLSLLSSFNSNIGILKNYNCRRLILEYVDKVIDKINNIIYFDKDLIRFRWIN